MKNVVLQNFYIKLLFLQWYKMMLKLLYSLLFLLRQTMAHTF